MSYRSLAIAVAALSSVHVASADAQTVYVAPGGVYIGAGPVYVTPAPNNGGGPYVGPTNGYEYGPPAVVAPPPAIAPRTTFYGPNGGYYGAQNGGYYGGQNGGYYYGAPNGGYYGVPLSAYAAEVPPRPPVAVPSYGSNRCTIRYGYGRSWQSCY